MKTFTLREWLILIWRLAVTVTVAAHSYYLLKKD